MITLIFLLIAANVVVWALKETREEMRAKQRAHLDRMEQYEQELRRKTQ